MNLQLSIGITDNPRTWPIIDGTVKPEGIDLIPTILHPSELFWRQLHFAEFAVSEMSCSSFMIVTGQGDTRFVGLPIFTTRRFFHTTILVSRKSGIEKPADLKGKRVGVTSMASAGVIIARAMAAINGMDPDRDISIVVAGEAAQTAALLRGNQVDALSQFDTQYALTENAGAKLRALEDDNKSIANFPSNGLVTLEETLQNKRAEALALAQGYAKGTVFAIANPEAAIRILWEVYPQTKATGKDEATALKDDLTTLNARIKNWRLAAGGVTKWGENSIPNYDAYVDFLVKNGVLKTRTPASDLVTNELIEDINKFEENEIADMAKAYK